MQSIRFRRTVSLFFIGIIFFFLFTSFVAFWSYIKPSKIFSDTTPEDLGLQYETISLQTKDNVVLHGWFIPRQTQDKSPQKTEAETIIALHGWPADKGNILPFVSFLNQTYNLFLFDFRSLGESEGAYSTVGAKETEDLFAAIRYLKSRGIEKVGVWGFSMGGAVALMGAPQSPQIKAIVSEASYARLDLMAFEAFQSPTPFKYPLVFFIDLWARIFFRVNIKDVAPMEAVKQLNIPILLIHSKNDEVIPFSHAQLLQEALKDNERAEFWFQENFLHGQINPEYQQRILDFFEKNLTEI